MSAVNEASAETVDLVVKRVIDAPVERVWQAWTDEDLVKQWWGPRGFTAPVVKLDVREGGTSLLCMRREDFGDQYTTWHYLRVEPLNRLEYELRISDAEGNPVNPAEQGLSSEVPSVIHNVVTFTSVDGGKTEVSVTERDWPVIPLVETSRAGLSQTLDKLAECLGDSEGGAEGSSACPA